MCGRFVLKAPFSELVRLYGLTNSVNLEPRYNIPPTEPVAVVRSRDGPAISYFQSDEVPLSDVASMIPLGRVDGAGVMHTGAEVTADALAVVRRHFDGQLMAYPDSGYFEMPDWRFVDVIAPARGLTRSQVDRGSGVVWPVGGT